MCYAVSWIMIMLVEGYREICLIRDKLSKFCVFLIFCALLVWYRKVLDSQKEIYNVKIVWKHLSGLKTLGDTGQFIYKIKIKL